MSACLLRSAFLFLFLLVQDELVAQVGKKIRQYNKRFQFSVFPGTSTNGVSSGHYFNRYSLNLFGGLSAGNEVLEIGLFTNHNLKTTTGIQLAGLANITGANAFINLSLYEERALINTEDFEVNRKGIQVAGLLNYVLNYATGIQVSGGLNVVGDNFSGFQLAGIGNSADGTSHGVMIAGLYNVSKEAVGGFQIGALFNYTDRELSGLQFGMINKARWMRGKHSTPPTITRGLQIGILNFAREMDGMQIGLINFGGAARGKQIGLINFFYRAGSKEFTRMGTPIGLLNIGSRGTTVRVFYNELFPYNLEYSTGNCLNCTWVQSGMPYHDSNRIFNQNPLIIGYDPYRDTWGFGWGFQKMLYVKVSMLPLPFNERRVINYGIKFLHLNRSRSFDRDFNLLNRLNLDWGKRWRRMYFFASVTVNYFLFEDTEAGKEYKANTIKIPSGRVLGLNSELWPGYAAGVQIMTRN